MKSSSVFLRAIIASCGLALAPSIASVHASDACGPGATVLTIGSPLSGDNTSYTTDTASPPCITWESEADDFYIFTPPAAGDYLVTVTPTTPFSLDSIVSAHIDCNTGAAALGCVDDTFDGDPEVMPFTVTTTDPVTIRVAAYYDDFFGPDFFTGPYTISVTALSSPTNDHCDNAAVIASLPASVSASAALADDETFDVDCNSTSNTVFRRTLWWTITPTESGLLSISQTSSNDTSVAVFSGSCGAMTALACQDPENFTLEVTADTQYWIAVGMWSAFTNPGADYALTLELLTPPDNDSCDTPTEVPFPAGGMITSDGRGAGNDLPDVACNDSDSTDVDHGVWYTFTTGADAGTVTIGNAGFDDTVFAMFTGTCGALTEVGCSDPDPATFPFAANTTYSVLVGMWFDGDSPAEPYAMSFTFNFVTGACCAGGNCSLMTHSQCDGLSGSYSGDGVPCAGSNGTNATSGAIPDSDDIAVGETTRTIATTGTGTVSTIEVTVNVSHSWVGDLGLKLTAPDGTTSSYLVIRPGRTTDCLTPGTPYGSSNDFIGVFTFSDAAATSVYTAATGGNLTGGTFKAAECGGAAVALNTIFAGQAVAGDWTLAAQDFGSGITGTLNSVSISLNGGITIVCSTPCPGNHDGNGQVDADDLFAFLDDWFAQNGTSGMGLSADYDGNDAVDADDLFTFLDIWFAHNGDTCP